MDRTPNGKYRLTAAAVVVALVCGCSGGDGDAESLSGVPDGFRDLCAEADIDCQGESIPPDLVGIYTGTGETIAATSEYWSVGSTADVTIEVLDQHVNGGIEGLIDVNSTTLEIRDAVIRGTDRTFSIYGRLDIGSEECLARAKGIITGTASDAAAPTQVTGKLAVEFTEVLGPECTAEDQAEAGRGATFSFTVQRHDGPIARWSECILPQFTDQDETCGDYCTREGHTCSLGCGDDAPLRTAGDCNSNVWAGPLVQQDCSTGIWESGNQAARCCCE